MLDIPDEVKAAVLKTLEGDRSAIQLAREVLIVGPSFDVEHLLFSARDEFLKIGGPVLMLEDARPSRPLIEEIVEKIKYEPQVHLTGRNRHEKRKQRALARRERNLRLEN